MKPTDLTEDYVIVCKTEEDLRAIESIICTENSGYVNEFDGGIHYISLHFINATHIYSLKNLKKIPAEMFLRKYCMFDAIELEVSNDNINWELKRVFGINDSKYVTMTVDMMNNCGQIFFWNYARVPKKTQTVRISMNGENIEIETDLTLDEIKERLCSN